MFFLSIIFATSLLVSLAGENFYIVALHFLLNTQFDLFLKMLTLTKIFSAKYGMSMAYDRNLCIFTLPKKREKQLEFVFHNFVKKSGPGKAGFFTQF